MHNLYLLENRIAQDLPLVEDRGIATPTQIIFLEKENGLLSSNPESTTATGSWNLELAFTVPIGLYNFKCVFIEEAQSVSSNESLMRHINNIINN